MTAKKSGKKKPSEPTKLTSAQLADHYWDKTLTLGQRPHSIYIFCKELEISEAQFYEFNSSFDELEASYWNSCITDTIEVLENDEDYANYDTQQKLLAFYFTFFSHIQNHRSRYVQCFPSLKQIMPKTLGSMRKTFTAWADELIQNGIEQNEIADRKKLNTIYSKGLFEQLRFLIDYYKKDNSKSFQDTDALIEKSVRFFTDSARSGVIDSALDLARFMLRRLTP